MDQYQFKRYFQLYKDLNNQTLVEQIWKVEIFKTVKEERQIGERVSSTEQESIIEEIVDGKPMFYAGGVNVIDAPNFFIRVVKKSRRNSIEADGDTKLRIL